MKVLRTLLSLGIATIVFVSMSASTVSADTSNFTINSFEADYYLERDGERASRLRVEERIVAQFPNFNQNHGIERSIPLEYQGHSVGLSVESVTDASNKPWNYTVYESNGNKVLRIGDADKYVQGVQVYSIKYSVRDVISFQPNGDEFYWDVNGNDWGQQFNNVVARLHVPVDLMPVLTDKQACFSGGYGTSSNGSRCEVVANKSQSGTIVTATAKNLAAQEGLTMVVGFKPGEFALSSAAKDEKATAQQKVYAAFGLGLGIPLIASAWMIMKWRSGGRDAKGRGVIIPEYVPPKKMTVMQSGFLLNENLESKEVTAAIISLAVKGYVEIIETTDAKGKNPKFKLKNPRNWEGLSHDETELMRALFSAEKAQSEVELDSLKNKLYTKLSGWNKDISGSLQTSGYYNTDPVKAKQKYYATGAIVLFLGFGSVFLPTRLYTAPGLIGAGLIILAFARYMPAKTEKGVVMKDYLKGLKEYIALAEKDRIAFLQSPEGAERISKNGDPTAPENRVKLFEGLLPYAMLFGLEKQWAKQFESLYSQPPSWYHGNNYSTFSTVYLASSLGGFSNSTSNAFSAPSSSSSSGFGGGGFSGGGGGGGGGGGW